MRKEVSIAVIIGIILGAVILYGIKIANQTTSSLPKPTPTPTAIQISPEPNKNSTPEATLNITSHTTNQVLFEKDIVLIGKSTPKTILSVITEDEDIITTTDDKGAFNQKITLIPGENNIQVDHLDSQKQIHSQTLKLYYSTKPIE